LLLVLSVSLGAGAGTTQSLLGEVVSAPASADRHLVVKRDGGGTLTVRVADDARVLRLPPGGTSLEQATPVALDAIAAGDRVLCRGSAGAEPGTFSARLLVVMTRADLDARREREREEWRRHGVAGVVTALDPAALQIALRLSGGRGTLVVACGPKTAFRRYRPGSSRFADARPSRFGELALGDQVRVLGDRDDAGERLLAEQVVSGAFRVVRGVLSEVDATHGLVRVREVPSGESEHGGENVVELQISPATLLRRLPPMLVMRLMRASTDRSLAGEAGADTRLAEQVPRLDPDEILERLPPVGPEDLRPGDQLAAVGPRQPDGGPLAATKLVVWTLPSWPETRSRSRRGGNQEPADPFLEVLGVGGETPW
jgi:hypothetical protein